MNPRLKGRFLNEAQNEGWDCWYSDVEQGCWPFWWREKQLYIFQVSERTPVMFLQEDGTKIMPGRPGEQYQTDFGSVPPVVQGVIRKEGVEYPFHDFMYKHGFIWVKRPDGGMFEAIRVSRSCADRLLCTMSQCTKPSPRGLGKATAIWVSVRALGWTRFREFSGTLPAPFSETPEYDPPDVDDVLVSQ